MKKVLLIDTAFAAMPIYDYLVKEGFDVWVMGNRSSDALAIHASDRWIQQDYSKVEEVKRHILEHGIEYVVPGCTDVSIETALALGINGDIFDDAETYKKLGNKNEFRKICADLDLPSPYVVQIEDFPRKGNYICKPVDAFSGRGVTVVEGDDVEAVQKAYRDAMEESVTGTAIIESFITGQLHSFSVFIENGKAADFFVAREGSSVNRYAVDTSFVDDSLNPETTDLLKNSIEKMVEHMKLKDGLFHLQFILDGNDPYMIEVSRRHPGDLYSLLIEYSTGYKYAAKYASFFVKKQQNSEVKYQKSIIRHTVASDTPNDFMSLKFVHPLQTYAFYPLLSLGNKVHANQKTRVGLLFVDAGSLEAREHVYNAFISRSVYKLNELH